jgi:hypothetical protein
VKHGPIARRDWFEDSMPRVESSFRLYRANRIPDSIEIFMVVTPLKHALRAAYGKGNLGVAWILLKEAVSERIEMSWIGFRYRIGWLDEDMKDAKREME